MSHQGETCCSEDYRILKKQFGVMKSTVDAMIEGGIDPNHLSEVCEYWQASQMRRGGEHYIIKKEQIGVKNITVLYQLCEGDIDIFCFMMDYLFALANDRSLYLAVGDVLNNWEYHYRLAIAGEDPDREVYFKTQWLDLR